MYDRLAFVTAGATNRDDERYLSRTNALVVTKPIGHGTLFAAIRAISAPGRPKA
jgi:selenophosphate synthase